MPIIEYTCQEAACPAHGERQERFLQKSTPQPVCLCCGGLVLPLISPFSVTFVGPITARYNDRNKENSHKEGHWAVERNTLDGKPKWTFIDTWEKRKAFMKQEKLTDQVGNIDGSSDGRVSSSSGMGMPGTWA